MPQKVIRFKGINRKINEFQSSGECEELINVRPIASGMQIVKAKKEKFADVEYDVYNHTFGDKSIFIGVIPENNFRVLLIEDDGSEEEIDSFNGNGPDYSIAFIGNQVILSHGEEIKVYAYKNNEYVKVNACVPDNLDITYTVSSNHGYSGESLLNASDPDSYEFKEETMRQWSAAVGQNDAAGAIFGPVMVAFNFSMEDGTEFWTNKWIYINPFLYLPNGENGRNMVYYESGSSRTFVFRSYTINFNIAQIQKDASGADNLVKSVNVYATRPVFPYDIDKMSAAVSPSVHNREIYANVTGMEGSGITKELLYFQKSILVSKLEDNAASFTLDFRQSQAGEKILDVDAGPVKRSGKIASYNNRAHFYDSYATLVPQSVVCLSNENRTFYERNAYVYLDCNNEDVVIKTKAHVPLATSSANAKLYCVYPDARAKKIMIDAFGDSYYCTINLQASKSYNYAWGESAIGSRVDSSSIRITSNTIHEANAINVSAQYNPFVFPVENSYSLGGKILDLSTAYIPISSTQIGQYPLTVFTSNGIYAMEQGSGSVLYGNIIPLQPLVSEGRAAATPYGTFFVSSKSIYLLSGREVANTSYALEGELELGIRDNEAYRKLYCKNNSQLYNFEPLLSKVDFENFISSATLTYDQLQNELYISNADYPYSYVLNLGTKEYHKVARRYLNPQNGARYAIEVSGNTRNVVDLHTEEKGEQNIFLQSRPMPLDAAFTHIHRLIMFADAKLEKDQNLCISVFASDNLYDWKCIISSQKHDTVLRQIRTNRAAKSYRDYVIIISGTVHTDTDLSDLIADYTVVARRLG